MPDNIDKLYDALNKDGVAIGRDKFRKAMEDPAKREGLYKAMQKDGYKGDFATFEKNLGYGEASAAPQGQPRLTRKITKNEAATPAAATPQATTPKAVTPSKPAGRTETQDVAGMAKQSERNKINNAGNVGAAAGAQTGAAGTLGQLQSDLGKRREQKTQQSNTQVQDVQPGNKVVAQGGGASAEWSEGKNVKVSSEKKSAPSEKKLVPQDKLYVDENGKPAIGLTNEDVQSIERSELYYPLMRNDSINVRNTEAFRKGWMAAPKYDKNKKFKEARAAGYKAQGEKFKNLTDEQLVKAMREEEKKLDGSTSPAALQATMNVTYIETLMAAREWGLGDVANLKAVPHMVDYHQAKAQFNKNGLVDKYENNMLTGKDDNPLLIRGWELIEEQWANDEAAGVNRGASYYRNLPFKDPKFAEEFGAYITARIKRTGERWNDAVKDAIDDFEVAAEEGRVGKKHSEEYLGSANRQQVDAMLADVNSALKKRMDELDKKHNDRSWFQRMGESSGHDPNLPNERYLSDPDASNYMWAGTALNDAKKIIAAFDANRLEDGLGGFFSGAGRGLVESIGDLRTWDGGASDMLSAGRLQIAVDKYIKGKPLSQSEKALLEATSLKLATAAIFKEVGRGYKAGKVTGESLPFMIEMALNPISSSGSKIASGLAKYAKKYFGKFLEKMVMRLGRSAAGKAAKNILKTGAKAGARFVGDAVAATGMAVTSGLGHTTANTIGYKTGNVQYQQGAGGKTHFGGVQQGDDWVTATLKGIGSTAIENASEMWGEYFKPLTKFFGRYGSKALDGMHLGAVNKWVKNFKSTEASRMLNDFRKQTRWDGTIAEYLEEVGGNIANALTVGDMNFSVRDKNGKLSFHEEHSVFNWEDNVDTFLGVSLMGGAMSTYQTIGYRSPTQRARKNVERWDNIAKNIFAKTESLGGKRTDWGTIKDIIQNGSDEQVKELMVNMAKSKEYNAAQRRAAIQYAGAVYALKGVESGEQNKEPESPLEGQLKELYGRGYNAANYQAISDANTALQQAKRNISWIPQELLDMIDEEPAYVYEWAANNPNWSEQEKQQLLDYLNAKATYDGAQQRLQDDEASARAEAEYNIDQRTAKTKEDGTGGDGMIHPVVLKNGNRVYVTGGNVTANEDGTISADTDELVVVDENNNVKMIDKGMVESVEETLNPADEKQQAADKIHQAYAEMTGEESGDSVEGEDETGNTAGAGGSKDDDGIVTEEMLPSIEETVEWMFPNASAEDKAAYVEQYTNNPDEILKSRKNLAIIKSHQQQGQGDTQQPNVQAPAATVPGADTTTTDITTDTATDVDAGTDTGVATGTSTVPPAEYHQDDLITVNVNGQQIRGQVTQDMDDNGKIEIYLESPVNKRQVMWVTPEELNAMLVSHTPREAASSNAQSTNSGEESVESVESQANVGNTVTPTTTPAAAAVQQPTEQTPNATETTTTATTPQATNNMVEADVNTVQTPTEPAAATTGTTPGAVEQEDQGEEKIPVAAMPMKEVDGKQVPDFDSANAEQAHDYLYGENTPYPAAVADRVVDNTIKKREAQVAAAQQAFDEAQALEPEIDENVDADNIQAINDEMARVEAAKQQAGRALMDAKNELNKWRRVQEMRSQVQQQAQPTEQVPEAGTPGVENEDDMMMSSSAGGGRSGQRGRTIRGRQLRDMLSGGQQSRGESATPNAQSTIQNEESPAAMTSQQTEQTAPATEQQQPAAGERSYEEMTPDERIEQMRKERLRERAQELSEESGVPINVAESLDEVPAKYRKEIEAAHRNGEEVYGWWANGQAWLYLPDIYREGMRRLDDTFLHEVVAHGGLRALFKNRKQTFNELCDQVFDAMSDFDKVNEINYYRATHLNPDGTRKPNITYADLEEVEKHTTEKERRGAADEYMAHLPSRRGGTIEQNRLQRILSAIRDALRKVFNVRLSDNDIVSLLNESRRNLTEMDKIDLTSEVTKAVGAQGMAEANNAEQDGEYGDMFSTSAIFNGAGIQVSEINDKGESVPLTDGKGNMVARINGKEFSASNPVTVADLKPEMVKVRGKMQPRETSVLQMLIADAQTVNNLSDKEVETIYQNYADLLNMYLYMGSQEMGGPDTVLENWQWLGETVFRTVAANGDAQYSYSMDIIRVCKKNEAVIKAMSALQLKEGRGATPSEIVDIYRNTHVEGYQVPCPVCYVFTRYIRNGKYASAAIKGMTKYGEHLPGGSDVWTVKQWRDELDKLNRQTNPDYKPDGKNKMTGEELEKAKRFKKQLDWANEITVKYEKRVNALSYELTKPSTSEARQQEILDEIKVMDAQYKSAVEIIAHQALTNWIKTHAIEENKGKYKIREDAQKPADMEDYKRNALDLRLTANTIVQYPAIQRLRKSGGSAAGKEIGFASDNRLGEVVMGLGISNTKLGSYPNIYEQALSASDEKTRKKFRKAATDRFRAASVYAAMQTLRGGQRMWSWSDNIERLSPDVAVNIMQLQLLKGAMQTYSKQLEGIKLTAMMGAYVNGSLMAKDNGWLEVGKDDVMERDGELWLNHDIEDEIDEPQVGGGTKKRRRVVSGVGSHVYQAPDGKMYVLQYDDIVGVDPYGNHEIEYYDEKTKKRVKKKAKGLFDLNAELDKAGNILVGMNDLHIRAALADPRVFFVIPWHSSGANNHILSEMLEILGQTMTDRLDYTDMQEEKNMAQRDKDSKKLPEVNQRLRDLWEEGRKWAEENGWKSGMEVDSNGDMLSESQYVYRQLRSLIFNGSIFEEMPSEQRYKAAQLDKQLSERRIAEETARMEAATDEKEKKRIKNRLDTAKRDLKNAQHIIDLHDGMIDWRDSALHEEGDAWSKKHPKRINVEEAKRMIQADEFLKQVYDRVAPIGEMTSKDNTYIYPYEYWDESSTYDNADINGKRYVEYCRRMGYKPKFSGRWGKGTTDANMNEGNFVHDPGYWKLLIDRRMYNTKGEYQWLDPVSSDNFSTDLVNPAETGKEFHVTRVADDIAAEEIADKTYNMMNERTEGGVPEVDYNKPLEQIMDEYDAAMAKGKEIGVKLDEDVDAAVENDGEVMFSIRQKPAPVKTQKVYKLMRLGDDGKLYPLFIDGAEPIELGVWYDADSPNMDMLTDLPNGVHLIMEDGSSMTMEEYYKENGLKFKPNQKYPSKAVVENTPNGQRWVYIEPTERGQRRFGGESRRYWNIGINGSGSVSTFSMRPGWHSGSLPTMRQIGKGPKKNLRDDRFVWVEGYISADVDYNEEAQGNPDNDIPTHIPTDGYYLKATNANAKASQADRVGWYISGAFMPNRIISDSEARQVIDEWNNEHPDLQVEYDFPRESGKEFNAETMQLEDAEEIMFSRSLVDENSEEEIEGMRKTVTGFVSQDNLDKAYDAIEGIKDKGAQVDAIFNTFDAIDPSLHAVNYVPEEYLRFTWGESVDNKVYCTMGHMIDHAVTHHPEMEAAWYPETIDIVTNPDRIVETYVRSRKMEGKLLRSVVYVKDINGRRSAVVTSLEQDDNGNNVLKHKTFFGKYSPENKKGRRIYKNEPNLWDKDNGDNPGLVTMQIELPDGSTATFQTLDEALASEMGAKKINDSSLMRGGTIISSDANASPGSNRLSPPNEQSFKDGKVTTNSETTKENAEKNAEKLEKSSNSTENGEEMMLSTSNYSLGVPYQGTKGRFARKIVDMLPSGSRFVDLFSGGGAVTHAAMLSGKYGSYHMNDLDGVGQELFMQGVRGEWDNYDRTSMTPEEFKEIKGTPEAIPWSYNGLGRNLAKGGRPDYINRVKRLGQLSDMADDIETSIEDYRDVVIMPGDVVYCDIPYEKTDTRGYGKGRRFDKQAFVDWAQAQEFPVYVSEYTMPDGWVEIGSIDVRSMDSNQRRTEKLWVQEKFADQYREEMESDSRVNNATDETDVMFSVGDASEAFAENGGKAFDKFLDDVFDGLPVDVRREIVTDAVRNYDNDFRAATNAWLSSLVDDEAFAQVPSKVWNDIKQRLSDTLYNEYVDGIPSDNEARYVLWRGANEVDGVFDIAEDAVMRDKLRIKPEADEETPDQMAMGDDGVMFSMSTRDRAIARDAYERMMRSSRWQWIEAMQDSMISLKKLMQLILGDEYTHIKDVPMGENAYVAENRMTSMTAAQQAAYNRDFIKPMLKEIAKLCKGKRRQREKARQELTDYLMAKHGLERNQVLADRDAQETAAAGGNYQDAYQENREKDYSGLTALTGESDIHAAETKAQQMVDDYEAQHDTTELWNRINAATSVSLEKQYKSGILSFEQYQKIKDMFEFYVPLRGWDETTSDEVYGYLTSKAGPFLGGSIVKRAEGRTSKADDPIATIAKLGDDSIRTANRNLMKRAFLNFVMNHPSDLVSVSELWLQYDDVKDEWVPVFADIDKDDSPEIIEQKIESFEQQMAQLAQQEPDKYKHGRETANIPYRVIPGMEREHQVLVKKGGQTYVLTINGDPKAAQALNGLTNPDVENKDWSGEIIKGGKWINRALSALYTTLSPAFLVSNFFRDSIYSNNMVWVKEGGNYAIRFNKNYFRTNPVKMRKLLGKWEKGTLDNSKPLERMFNLFMLQGGETGFAMAQDLEDYKKNVAKEIKSINGVNAFKKIGNIASEQYELLGRSIENCARFAAFVTSMEMGRSAERAAFDAKEISVNFNKKGSGGKMIGNMDRWSTEWWGALVSGLARDVYTFWNAGVQGMTNMGSAVVQNPGKAVRRLFTKWFAYGFFAPMLASVMGAAAGGGDGDDDDKNAYYNLPEYVRRSNLCLYLGGLTKYLPESLHKFSDAWLTIPLPIEFRSIYGLGELTYGAVSGNEHYTTDEMLMQYASQFSQLLPIDMLEGGGGFHPFIPTLLKPFVESETNVSWSGTPVYKADRYKDDEKKPAYTKVFSNTNEYLVAGAEWLNRMGGGDDRVKADSWWFDWNPAKVEYMLKGYFGGIYSFPMEIVKFTETTTGKRDFEWRNVPLANRVFKQGDDRTEARALKNRYFKLRAEYEDVKFKIKEWEDAGDSDVFKYAEKLDKLNHSKEYGHYEIFKNMDAAIQPFTEAREKTTDPDAIKEYEDMEVVLMRQMVNMIDDYDKGKEVDSEAAMREVLMYVLNNASDKTLLAEAKKEYAKSKGARYSFGSGNATAYNQRYDALAKGVDVDEDAELQHRKRVAKDLGDEELYKALGRASSSLTDIRRGKHTKKENIKGLGEGDVKNDMKIMEQHRKRRREILDMTDEQIKQEFKPKEKTSKKTSKKKSKKK